jgi:HK97 family phage major capsid protein
MSKAERRHASFAKSLGQQFVESEAMDYLTQTKGRRGGSWSSPNVELTDPGLQAATLTSDAASGGDLIIPDYRPGIVPLLFKRLVVADLIASGTTDSNLISYMKETTFTNAAAPVAEGGTKPESTLIFDAVTDAVQKIAHWLPVTEEMLEDVAQIRAYIDARLRLGVELTEEDQLLNGSGTAPAIRGILNRTGLATAVARGTDTNVDAIFKQIWAIFTTAFIMPDGVVLNPANWQTIALSKDANGQYYGGGPFVPAAMQTLWGLPAVKTPTIASGTALVGAFRQAAQVFRKGFRKGGMRVEASNSHSDYFVKNLVAIRAEERLALAVYRPGAFGTVTGLN